MTHTWHLASPVQSFVLHAQDSVMPEVIYWGSALGPEEDLEQLAKAHRSGITSGMLDELPPLSLCPERSTGFCGQPGLEAIRLDGTPVSPRFFLSSNAQETPGTLALTFQDEANRLNLNLHFSIDQDTSVLTFQSELTSAEDITLTWLSASALPCPPQTDRMLEFSGRWLGEFQTTKLSFAPGARERTNRTGRTDHSHFPGLVVCSDATVNTCGEAYGFHYGWSGGHTMVAEELPDGRRQVQFGHAKATQGKGKRFKTAPLYAVWSNSGFNGVAKAFQRHARTKIVQQVRPKRPVHYNCWEAVYFNHDLDLLKDIATRASDLGAERFILDDGWFAGRQDDTSSLGDWVIDRCKHPNGLAPLISHVQALGMEFGLWFEPEMISENSDLFRAHPNWVLGPLDQPVGRNQLVLNLARQDVQDYLFEQIEPTLATYDIGYVKWDHNRILPECDATQAISFYKLLDRLRAAFPQVEFESCAAGGARIDFGVLERTQRVWLSDSNDAMERQKIQHNAALFLPASITGSHVGPRKCHTSGRMLDIRFRAWTAAQRHMGFEVDPRELTAEETSVLKTVTSWWKSNRHWMMEADILRLDTSDTAEIAEMHVAEDRSRFVVFSALLSPSAQILPHSLRLTGLDPDRLYSISLVNRSDASVLAQGRCALQHEDLTLSGRALMHQGVLTPWRFPESIWVIEGRQL